MWSADFDFNKEVLQTIPISVKYPNLPLNCWGKRSLSRISSGLGIPLYADACTTQVDRISYARVLVEMDVTKELPRSIKVTDPNGKEFMQEITYVWEPVKEQLQSKETTNEKNANTSISMASTSAGGERGNEEQRWKTVIGKSAARSRERQPADVVNVINGFNLLAESKLQLAMPRQIEGGTGRHQGDTGQEAVYGLHSIEDRRSMWSELTRLNSIQQGPWLIMGDYNATRSAEDRPIDNPVQELEVRNFNDFIEDTGLTEMKTSGRNFTWTNGHTYSKIDRALINVDWMLVMPQLEVWIMDPHCSDHLPLSIALEENEDFSSKPFKFLNHLAEHDDFIKIVNEAWERPQEQHNLRCIWQKLKRVKQAMKSLNKNEYNTVGTRIKVCRQKLTVMQEQMRDTGQDETLVAEEKEMKK
ncbi:uncharacterized protein [Nicotiana sylvestris]|uniref:uncharacterized protein n=1 Tax=Nicotiana sylvestris TaxID=4096 RepID=UPI00388C4749